MPADAAVATRHFSLRRELLFLSLVLLLGLSIRAFLAITSGIISRDTCTFVWFAQDLRAKGPAVVREYDQHPLYPLSINAGYTLLNRAGLLPLGNQGWAQAAIVASAAAGIGCILLFWALARQLFGAEIALLTALFAAVLPELARCSADGLSDPLHLLLYLAALWLGVTGLSCGSLRRLLGAGFCAGLAFLTRPEGAVMALVLAPACLVISPSDRWRTRALLAAAVAVGFALPAAPYATATGKLIQKKPIEKLFPWFHEADAQSSAQADDHPPHERLALAGAVADGAVPRRLADAVVLIVRKWVRTCRVVYFVLAAVGLAACRWPAGRHAACALITAAGCVHFLLLMLLVVNFDYAEMVSLRHTLILAALILPWAAAGTAWIVASIHQRLGPHERRQEPRPSRPAAALWTIVLLCIIVPTAYWLLRPLHPGAAFFRQAGRWLAENRPQATLVMTTEPRVAFYAEKRMQRWPAETGRLDELLAHLDLFQPAILALDVHRVTRASPTFINQLQQSPEACRRLRRIAAFPAPHPPDAAPALLLFDVLPAPTGLSETQPPQ